MKYTYQCETCNHHFDTEEDALECERNHNNPKIIVTPFKYWKAVRDAIFEVETDKNVLRSKADSVVFEALFRKLGLEDKTEEAQSK